MVSIMGVLNVTPDSFYDKSRFIDYPKAIAHAHQMIAQGACIIDVGGESTRPGAQSICVSQECDRVLPIIQALAKDFKHDNTITLSIDTRHPEVMRQAIECGAGFINDVNALQGEMTEALQALLNTLAQHNLPVCLMHMQGEPSSMQIKPEYTDVVLEVKHFLESRLHFCVAKGLKQEQIILDPGFGFGKTVEHNTQLLKNLDQFKALGTRVLVGLSRKSFIEKWLQVPTSAADRLAGSLAASVIAVLNGADIIRTHDVKATVDAVKIAEIFKL